MRNIDWYESRCTVYYSQFVAEPIEIIEEPSPQEVKEGCSKLRLVFKCKVRGDGKLTYQWYKDGTKLPGKTEDTLVLKSVMLRDFGLYTCNCTASCKDGSSYSKDSLLVEVDVTPRDGMSKYRAQSG